MKKILLLGIAILFARGLYSNPIVYPVPHINELQVYFGGHWTMEVLLGGQDYFFLDSVKVQNNAGFAKVISMSFVPDYGYFGFYFTDYDLDHSILADETGDIFIVTLYFPYGGGTVYDVSDALRYGNVTNPQVYAPTAAQSIERFWGGWCSSSGNDLFTNCNFPTPGFANDTTGTYTTMEGIVYDMDNQPVPNQQFRINNYFTTDSTGHYSTRVFSRICTIPEICYEKWPGAFYTISITPVSYATEPDTLITRNILLLDPLLVGIDPEPKQASQVLSIFPNPVKTLITISWSTDLLSTGDDPELFSCNITGKLVIHKPLTYRQGVINLPVDLPDGLYLATLKAGSNLLGTNRFIVSQGK